MITIKAKIKLFKGKGVRQTSIKSGYRPLFLFDRGSLTSGHITLIDVEKMNPGEERTVSIKFLHKDLLGDTFDVNNEFKFYESKVPLGSGFVLEIYPDIT